MLENINAHIEIFHLHHKQNPASKSTCVIYLLDFHKVKGLQATLSAINYLRHFFPFVMEKPAPHGKNLEKMFVVYWHYGNITDLTAM